MKVRNSLVLVLALILMLSILFTGCQQAAVPENAESVEIDVAADENVTFDDVEEYGFWDYWFGYYASTQKTTQKATQKATQKVTQKPTQKATTAPKAGASLESVMDYNGKAYAVVYNNKPQFQASEITDKAYEFYSPLDSKGRCGYVQACVGKELMPTGTRGSISSVKPTGWVQKVYSTSLVNGGSLYNRCHLIGWQLTGENANKKNLITGTRYMNENMIPYENMIADYIKETGNHVMYRVTPVFEGNNLVASGVHMEAYSVEDRGEGVCFNVYLYNVQPGITINYKTGTSELASSSSTQKETSKETAKETQKEIQKETQKETTASTTKYVLNAKSKKIHKPTCSSVNSITAANRKDYAGSIDSLLSQGYSPCGSCKPN